MRENRAYHKLKLMHPLAHWQRIENAAGTGVFDANACLGGVEIWVECKQSGVGRTGLIKCKVQKSQIAWEAKRREAGGRTLVAVMADSVLFVLPGACLAQLAELTHVGWLQQHSLEPRSIFTETLRGVKMALDPRTGEPR